MHSVRSCAEATRSSWRWARCPVRVSGGASGGKPGTRTDPLCDGLLQVALALVGLPGLGPPALQVLLAGLQPAQRLHSPALLLGLPQGQHAAEEVAIVLLRENGGAAGGAVGRRDGGGKRQWRETLAGKHTLALASARWLADEIVAAYRLSAAPTILRIRSCRCFADSARRCIARCTRIMDLACTVANCASASSRTRRFSSMRRRSCWSSARRRRSDSIFSMVEDVVREWLRVKGVSFSANRFAQSQEALRLAACSSVGRRRKPRSRWRS